METGTIHCWFLARGSLPKPISLCTSQTPAGVKVNNAAALDQMGLDRTRLARLSVESYLQQILRFGFFHVSVHSVCCISSFIIS